MKAIMWCIFFLLPAFFCTEASATPELFAKKICKNKGFQCEKVTRKDSWSSLYPDDEVRDLVKRINRMNGFLKLDMVIAVPDQILMKSNFDFSPFPFQLKKVREKVIVIDQANLAWGAYNYLGQLVHWGPISAGSKKCFGSIKGCKTPSGTFYVSHKGDKDCYSQTYPIKLSGAGGGGHMPYCMFFYKGYALHGSNVLPGYNNSHGCVRLMIEDAKWLNHHFVETPKGGRKGTKVLILPFSKVFSEKLIK